MSSSPSFVPSGAAVANITTRATALKNNQKQGHKNERSSSNEVVEILSKRVANLCNLSPKKGFPHRFDGKLHIELTSKHWSPCRYCKWHKRMVDPSTGNFVPGSRRKRIFGRNLVRLCKEWEGTTMASCIVSSTIWGYDLTASETFIALIPWTTLNLLNHFKNVFTSFALSTLTVCFAMTNHLVSTVLFVADT